MFPDGNWAESSSTDCHSNIGVCDGVMHCLMLACWPHWECHTFASDLSWKEIIFLYDFCCQPLASQHVLADGVVSVEGG